MAQSNNTFNDVFHDIANAIRTKDGTTAEIAPVDMADRILNLEAGGSNAYVEYSTTVTEKVAIPAFGSDTVIETLHTALDWANLHNGSMTISQNSALWTWALSTWRQLFTDYPVILELYNEILSYEEEPTSITLEEILAASDVELLSLMGNMDAGPEIRLFTSNDNNDNENGIVLWAGSGGSGSLWCGIFGSISVDENDTTCLTVNLSNADTSDPAIYAIGLHNQGSTATIESPDDIDYLYYIPESYENIKDVFWTGTTTSSIEHSQTLSGTYDGSEVSNYSSKINVIDYIEDGKIPNAINSGAKVAWSETVIKGLVDLNEDDTLEFTLDGIDSAEFRTAEDTPR